MIDSATCTKAVSDIYLPRSLILEAKYKGYKISVVPNVSDESYVRAYCFDRNDEFTYYNLGNMTEELKTMNAVNNNKNKRTIELVDVSVGSVSAFITAEFCKDKLSIGFLSVSKGSQGKGLGSLLMKSIIEVAVDNKIKSLDLISEENTISYYRKFGMKEVDPEEFMPKMTVATPGRNYVRSGALTSYDPAYYDAQLLLPIPYKKI